MTAGSEDALIRLLTAFDNSKEPRGAFNYPGTTYGLVIPFMVVSWFCVVFRLYTRVFILRCPWWDDLFVLLFRISGTIGSIFICLSIQNGFGEHFLTIGQHNMVEFQKKFYVSLATYTVSTTLMKLCLLTQYLRVFNDGSRARRVCWVGLFFSAIWGVAFSFMALAPCFPISAFWDWTSPGVCYGFGSKNGVELAGTFAGHTASNVVLDLMVLAIPVPLYFRKNVGLKQRWGIGCLLLLGVGVNLLSIWRLQSVVQTKAATFPVVDPTWYGAKSIVLAAVEVDLASICASIPVFWPVLNHGLGKIFVTQEVHITRQHRRLSGDDQYELQPSASTLSQHTRADSETSLTLGAEGTKTQASGHYQDKYIMNSVIPLGMDNKEAMSESQVQSEGHKGYKREQQERFGNSSERSDSRTEVEFGISRKSSKKF